VLAPATASGGAARRPGDAAHGGHDHRELAGIDAQARTELGYLPVEVIEGISQIPRTAPKKGLASDLFRRPRRCRTPPIRRLTSDGRLKFSPVFIKTAMTSFTSIWRNRSCFVCSV